MISQTTEYALRAAVCLAAQAGSALTLPDIAEATAVPAGYLSKVLQTLRRAGVVNSRRGKKGGFTLARDPGEISLYDVVHAVSPIDHLRLCPLTATGDCSRVTVHGPNPGLCPLHSVLLTMSSELEERFRSLNLSQVLANSPRLALGSF